MDVFQRFLKDFQATKSKKRKILLDNTIINFLKNTEKVDEENITRFLEVLKNLLNYIKSNFATLNYQNLGLENYTKSGTIKQWNYFFQVLKSVLKNDNNFKNVFKEFINNKPLHGYGRTGTVSPLLFVLSNGKFPIINGVTIDGIKLTKLSETLFKGKLTKLEKNKYYLDNIAYIDKVMKLGQFRDYEELDRFFYETVKKSKVIKENTNEESHMRKQNKQTNSLNQILYGPPGTGKTYNTINKALEIINGGVPNNPDKRKKVKERFDELRTNGQIEFVTFHQSYGYEEFVEGIKAIPPKQEGNNTNEMIYDVTDGVFKRLCNVAKELNATRLIYDFDESNINIWKMSLGDSTNPEDEVIFDFCIKNNKLLLGFGKAKDFSACKTKDEIAEILQEDRTISYPVFALDAFKNRMKKGDIVLISQGNRKIRAIAKVTGDYHCLKDIKEDEQVRDYVQARDVEWLLVPDEPFSYEKILNKQLSQATIYNIKKHAKIDILKELLTTVNDDSKKNYVLIIDEINRGNISKIFGELITLIEDTKRAGYDESVEITLPYSGDKFSVPKNLYIIGTMNTADRSIALMDTALRRRFEFIEMMPNLSLLSNNGEEIKKYHADDKQENDLIVKDINIRLLLKKMNQRIEYLYDRDHTIGHAYFMSLKEIADPEEAKFELDNIFKNKIIPLLQEYFYDDWEKILMVLGEGFIGKSEIKSDIFTYAPNDYLEENIYTFSIKDKFEKDAYIKIYEKVNNTDENQTNQSD